MVATTTGINALSSPSPNYEYFLLYSNKEDKTYHEFSLGYQTGQIDPELKKQIEQYLYESKYSTVKTDTGYSNVSFKNILDYTLKDSKVTEEEKLLLNILKSDPTNLANAKVIKKASDKSSDIDMTQVLNDNNQIVAVSSFHSTRYSSDYTDASSSKKLSTTFDTPDDRVVNKILLDGISIGKICDLEDSTEAYLKKMKQDEEFYIKMQELTKYHNKMDKISGNENLNDILSEISNTNMRVSNIHDTNFQRLNANLDSPIF